MKALEEGAIPKRPPLPGEQWRINFSRVQWQTEIVDGKYQKIINPDTGKPFPEDNWVWSPQGVINMHYPEMWGFVQFSAQDVNMGMEQFDFQAQENVKWALRQIYYKQRAYKRQHGSFATNLALIEADTIAFNKHLFIPSLEVTATMFKAYCTDTSMGIVWHINHEGKVWR
jgi:hypothetical protein